MATVVKFSVLLLLCALLNQCDSQFQAFVATPMNMSVCVGMEVNISCVYNSTENVPDWIINNVVISSNEFMNFPEYQFIGGFSAGMGDYLVRVLSINITSTFQCTLSFSPPAISPVGTVTVIDELPVPTNDNRVGTTCINDAIVSWDQFSSDQICGPVSYDVTTLPSDGVEMSMITDTSYNITGLQPNSSYNVTVLGINGAGVGQSSITVIIPTMNDAVPDVIDLRNTSTNNDSITVTWDDGNTGYCGEVTYTAMISGSTQSPMAASNRMAMFSNLRNGTTYTITVTATNRAGSNTSTITVTTLSEARPSPPPPGDGSDSDSTGAIIGGVVGGIVAVIVIIVIIIVVYLFVIRPKGESDSDKKALKMSSPTNTSTGGRATVAPQGNLQSGPTEVYADIHKPVPHQTAATGEEYAVSNKKPKPQGPTEEYAQIDKSKKSGQQKIQYADLADLPQSTNDPSTKGPTSMYAQVA